MNDFKYLKWNLLFIITLNITAILSNALSFNIFVNADNLNPGIYSKDSKPFGIPYGDWLARWNQWFIHNPYCNTSKRTLHTGKVCYRSKWSCVVPCRCSQRKRRT